MIKKIFFVYIYLFLTTACSSSIKTIDSNLTIDSFSMTQFENNGDKSYSISSPKSIYIKDKQIYKLDKTEIFFYEGNKINYIINSKRSSLINNNKEIKLEGDVKLYDSYNRDNIISANNAFWNIDKSNFLLVGDVILINNDINLISSKAVLDKKENTIKFFKPVKYKYLDKNSSLKYNLRSENAHYDLDKKILLFESKKERIKSKLEF